VSNSGARARRCSGGAASILHHLARPPPAEFLNISPRVLRNLKNLHQHRRGGSFSWSEMNIAKMVSEESLPVLFVHDRSDKEVPHAQMEVFSNSGKSNFQFVSTEGMGHRRIVRDEKVVRDVCRFVMS
jgi:hypothetical protein